MATAIKSNEEPRPEQVDAQYQELQLLLVERLRALLAEAVPPLLRVDVERALGGEGKLLAPRPPARSVAPASLASEQPPQAVLPTGNWALLSLLVAQYLSPAIDVMRAGSVALAVECSVCAIDLFDDIIDGDQTATVQALGAPRTTNVAQALSLLAKIALTSACQQDADIAALLRLTSALLAGEMAVTHGQHRDLLAEQQDALDLNRDDCVEIARGKGGALMRLACLLGAMSAQADGALCDLFAELGELLGISYQLDNDCHALYAYLQDEPLAAGAVSATKSDLVRGKKTLPAVLAARAGWAPQEPSPDAGEQKEEYRSALRDGVMVTWGICLLYRERARDRLLEIENRTQRVCSLALRRLLGFG